jgi:hypothetical protein
MQSKANISKAIIQIVLRHQLELPELATFDKSINYSWFTVRILCLGISCLFSWAFTGAAKLFDLGKPSCVMATQTVVTLGISNNEWDIQVQHNWVCFTHVLQHPVESILLQCEKSGSLKDEPNLNVHFVQSVSSQVTPGLGFNGAVASATFGGNWSVLLNSLQYTAESID